MWSRTEGEAKENKDKEKVKGGETKESLKRQKEDEKKI